MKLLILLLLISCGSDHNRTCIRGQEMQLR